MAVAEKWQLLRKWTDSGQSGVRFILFLTGNRG